MPKTRALVVILGLAALGGGIWAVSSGRSPAPATDQSAAKRPLPVLTRPAGLRAVDVRLSAVGNVQPLAVVPVRSRVEGEVVKVHFTEGQEVREGDPLFSLDARAAEAARRQAEAQLARDKAQLERARADLARYTELLKVGSTTRQKLEQATADVAVLEAAIKADRAAIDTARLTMEYAAIKAPVTGRTGAINAKLGSLVKPGENTPMVTITQMRPVTVAFSVAESHLPRIRAALQSGPPAVAVTSARDPELNAEGMLTFLDSAIDTATGTIGLKATFANEDLRLWPGQFVTATLVLGIEAQALTVPAEAVQTGQNGAFVFIVNESTADIRLVTIDRVVDGWAVVTKGLAPGDKVVVEGQMRLAPGLKVQEKDPAQPPAARS